MPTPYLKKVAKETGIPLAQVEDKWHQAKQKAFEEGHRDEYGYIVYIFKNMIGLKESTFKSLFKSFIIDPLDQEDTETNANKVQIILLYLSDILQKSEYDTLVSSLGSNEDDNLNILQTFLRNREISNSITTTDFLKLRQAVRPLKEVVIDMLLSHQR